ncbi:hypothetical protein [Pandoraea anhela]|uniref:Uncharacterized protein n=1 Tax=Pandoraea anhela TaxID=2508295 RepID=A0A5E4SKS8_9BURK|nr:hypothetical protein [Pandoraea anhela]VVD76287.1 hypothetical protein PAN31108_00872 [Pandoraea anhela]
MPSIDSAFRPWRARSRAPLGRGRSGWVAWLIAALLCVQMWGLQHEIAHARELSGMGQRGAAHRVATATVARGGATATATATATAVTNVAQVADAGDGNEVDAADAIDAESDAAIAADWSVQSARATHTGFGTHHHHCHLFEGATLAAAMAVAMLQWTSAADTTQAPLRANGRSHASAVLLPFDSRAPPVAV